MNKTIPFTKIRFLMFSISLLIIISGIMGTVFLGGFNMGIDFMGGYNQQIQFAPVAFSITYDGTGKVDALIQKNVIYLSVLESGRDEEYKFICSDYETVDLLINDIQAIAGIGVTPVSAYNKASTARLLDTDYNFILDNESVFNVNIRLNDTGEIFATKEKVEQALAEFGRVYVQTIGAPLDQRFVIKIHNQDAKAIIDDETGPAVPVESEVDQDENAEADTAEADDEYIPTDEEILNSTDQNQIENKIKELLTSSFEEEHLLFQKKDFIGSTFSSEISRGVIWSIVLAFLLILGYITIRFKVHYAVAAIAALLHDISIMVGVIGTFQLEVTSTTYAAVLTIVGYSLNDTIVVFDRVRENFNLLRDLDKETIINTSITQSLSRTIITSVTTLLAVVSIFIFGTGVIKDFAFNLIIGIVVGTYSSIFIAAPIVLSWLSVIDKKQKRKQEEKIGKRKVTPIEIKPIVKEEDIEAGKEITTADVKRTQKKKKKKKKKKK